VFIKPHTGLVSLQKCCEHLGIEGKDHNALKQCEGLRTDQIKGVPGLWDALATYAVGDGVKALKIYDTYWPKLSRREQVIQDWSIRNYLRGRLRIDIGLLHENLHREEAERASLLHQLGLESPQVLRSTKSFADHLMALGVDVEYKNGKKGLIPAVAKSDEFMRTQAGSADPRVRLAVQGRLAFQSSMEITRTQRLIDMAEVTGGKMLIPLNYCAAHTGRFGGAENINVQNLKRGSLLRKAIKAPPGMKLVCVDASQIEARLVGWLAGCRKIADAFAAGRDLYAEFASVLYARPITKEKDPLERQVGKVSILQLGYQSGADKLQKKLEGSGIVVTPEQAVAYVSTYRSTYWEIRQLWKRAERTLLNVLRDDKGKPRQLVLPGLVVAKEGIKLPSGRWLYYPQLREVGIDEPANGVSAGQLVYWAARYKSWAQLYGGKIVENIIQAMARDVVIESQLQFIDDVVLQVHDDLVQVVPVEYAELRRQATIKALSTAPAWCKHPKLDYPPLSAEGYVSDCYADVP
jgi:DNA polymerase